MSADDRLGREVFLRRPLRHGHREGVAGQFAQGGAGGGGPGGGGLVGLGDLQVVLQVGPRRPWPALRAPPPRASPGHCAAPRTSTRLGRRSGRCPAGWSCSSCRWRARTLPVPHRHLDVVGVGEGPGGGLGVVAFESPGERNRSPSAPFQRRLGLFVRLIAAGVGGGVVEHQVERLVAAQDRLQGFQDVAGGEVVHPDREGCLSPLQEGLQRRPAGVGAGVASRSAPAPAPLRGRRHRGRGRGPPAWRDASGPRRLRTPRRGPGPGRSGRARTGTPGGRTRAAPRRRRWRGATGWPTASASAATPGARPPGNRLATRAGGPRAAGRPVCDRP